MYDVIVVGARCAGSPLAMLLARQGHRVLLVDRATFPSDTISAHYIHQPGMQILKRWGLDERVAATNCPPVSKFRFDAGPFYLEGSPPPAGEVRDGYAPRRLVLDKLLVDAAVEAGAELREGFSVQELLFEDGRVTGIRGKEKDGREVVEKAAMVVGADGMHSLVARAVQAREYNTRPAYTCGYYAYWSGLKTDGAELYVRDNSFFVAVSTNDGLTSIMVERPNAEFHEFRADVEGVYRRTIQQAPALYERLQSAQRETRFFGTAEMRNFFRQPYGPGWALVGDAGYHKDPITAQGMTDSFRDAEWLAEAIGQGFSGEQPIAEAMAVYEQRRNETVMPMYEHTCTLAQLAPPPPEMQQLLGALRGNQEETNRFFGIVAGTTPIPEFFSPDNIQKIMNAASGAAA